MRLNHPTGQAAEDAAWAYLQRHGCRLVARNWHCRFGELDLIVWDGSVLVFVEVRLRRGTQFGGAAGSLNAGKLAKVQRSAEYYLQTHPTPAPCRIDALLFDNDPQPTWLRNITG
ncbi:YraN family protein [Snodgrassella sp. CFCC 13594]|uniref:YraN family protein n=1 Tax=Snodgrassella sp. CFCC 13594 TaxID=1775559 RepID=UPI000835F170|nr:YraN family protein [Snodgrassella sp. CFCC 13594]